MSPSPEEVAAARTLFEAVAGYVDTVRAAYPSLPKGLLIVDVLRSVALRLMPLMSNSKSLGAVACVDVPRLEPDDPQVALCVATYDAAAALDSWATAEVAKRAAAFNAKPVDGLSLLTTDQLRDKDDPRRN